MGRLGGPGKGALAKLCWFRADAGGVGFAAVQIALAFGAKVFATVSPDRRALIEEIGVVNINRNQTVEAYVQDCTTARVSTSFTTRSAVKCWMPRSLRKALFGARGQLPRMGTHHALAPLSFRATTYSGVFTVLPLLSGVGHAHHGKILGEISRLARRIRFGHCWLQTLRP